MSDVGRWLDGLGLGQYAAAFAENDVDWDVLTELDEPDLEKLGLSLGHRKKLLKAIAGLAGDGERTASVAPAVATDRSPNLYTPKHIADRILSSRGVLEGERKQITVLFADIKGSLELIAGDDPERVQSLLDSVVSAMIEAVHRYEGTVNKVLGDGIMALFGAPLAHEDHAARACYAALAMQETVRRTAEETRRSHGVEMQIRVGLNSGEVVVRAIGNDLSMDYDAIGQTTHLAGRMEQLATPGTVRLTGDTLLLVEGLVQVESLGPIPIKGLAEPVEIFELVAATPTRARFRAAVARGLSRFVGRDTEIDALNRALARAGDGQGQIAAVVGEPGVGKTRLFYEFTHSHRTQGWLILESGSVSYGRATAYLPLIDLLKNYFQIEDRDEVRRIREKVTGKLLTLDESLKPILTALLALLDVPVDDAAWDALDPPQRRRRTLDAAKTLFLRESEAQPLVLIFEDLHWIDSETQAFLDSLIEGLPTARILLLVNYRPEYGHAWGSRTYYTQRRIDPLGPESASELLTALLGNDASVAQLAHVLIERTAGNPFFIEESVRTLMETGSIEGGPGAYRMTGDLDRVEVPGTVQSILAARIDRLNVEDKRLLQTASVIGKDVPFELLRAIADTGEDEIRRGLARLGAAEFLYETRLFPDLEYTFKHALTYEVAYGTLLHEQRRNLHRRIAEAIESLHGARLTEQFERLAHHCTEAGLAEQAIGYWREAGQRAMERSANAEAIGLLERGLELIETLPESPDRTRKEIAFRVALGVPLMTKVGVSSPETEQNYLRARALCEEVGDSAQLFPVLWGLWMGLQTQSRLHSACEVADQLLTVSQAVDDSTLRLQAHHCQWTSRFQRGELAAALEYTEQGATLYRVDDHHASTFTYGGHDPGVCSHNVGAIVLWLLGYAKQARKRQDAGLALSGDLGHPVTRFDALTNEVYFSVFQRDGRAARRNAEAVLNFQAGTEEMKFVHNADIASGVRGCVLADQGEVAAGLALIRDSVAPMLDYGVSWTVAVLSLMATALARHGDAQEGLELVTETLASVQRDDARWWEAELHRVQGEIFLADGPNASGRAEDCFRQALDIARKQSARSLELRAGTSLAHLWQGQDRPDDARDLLAPIYGWFTEGFDTADLKDAKALLDELS